MPKRKMLFRQMMGYRRLIFSIPTGFTYKSRPEAGADRKAYDVRLLPSVGQCGTIVWFPLEHTACLHLSQATRKTRKLVRKKLYSTQNLFAFCSSERFILSRRNSITDHAAAESLVPTHTESA